MVEDYLFIRAIHADLMEWSASNPSRARAYKLVLRSLGAIAGASLGAFVAYLVAQKIEGPPPVDPGYVIFGAIVGAVFVSTAVITHALRVPRWAATLIGGIALTWQVVVAWGIWTGDATGIERVAPGNLAGRIAFWGISQRPIDIIAIVVTLAMVAAALALGGRLRLEPLARRGELVSQLRFAATVQDLRTVVLLRRQLRAEALRDRPWGSRRGRRRRGESPGSTTLGGMRLSVANHQKPSPTIIRPIPASARVSGWKTSTEVWRTAIISEMFVVPVAP